ncbi:MAG: zinc ribbon domain-containing protein [Actinomycetota bacterium]
MKTNEALSALSREIAEIKTEISVLEEQALFANEVAADASLRAMVAETPLADRESEEAQRDAHIAQRSLDEAKARLVKLQQEQDRLLEKLFEESGPSAPPPATPWNS